MATLIGQLAGGIDTTGSRRRGVGRFMERLTCSPDRFWHRSFEILWCAAALVALSTFLDYGLTWDEEVQREYAETILRWLATFGRDREALHYIDLYLYGGLFEVPAQLIGQVFPSGVYEGRHLATVLAGLAGVWGTYRLGTRLGGARTGFLAALFLLFTPLYYGHLFNNSKDIPFAAASVWALVMMCEAADELPAISWGRVIRAGVAVGIALGVRPGGVFHLGYIGALWGAGLGVHHLRGWRGARPFFRDSGRLVLSIGLVVVVGWTLMIACWPFGQVRPLVNPLYAIRQVTHFHFDPYVLLNGPAVRATQVPWTYLPVYFGVTLPEFYLLGVAAGLGMLPWTVRSWSSWSASRARAVGTAILAVVFPVAAAIGLRSTLYDGPRQFLFIVPPLAALAALGVSGAFDAFRWRVIRAGLGLVVAALLAWVAVDMLQLHPFQTVYYNRLIAGGVKGAEGRFELDYWGSSYREALEWVLVNYRPGTNAPVGIANCSDKFLSGYFLEKRASDLHPQFVSADWLAGAINLATTRGGCHRRSENGRVLHVVRRQGVALAYVFARDAPP